MKKLISIVVPIYNTGSLLKRCLNSIVNQTYKNLEILLIDDGSTDDSGKICDEYKGLYNNIKVFHNNHLGVSCSRNYGITIAKGEYILFIDSDDFIDCNYVSNLYNTSNKYNSDLVISTYIDYYDNDKIKIQETFNITKITKETCIKKMLLQDKMDVSVYAKLYKKCIFDNIKFPEDEIYEDFKIFYKVVEQAKNIYFIDYKGYYYYQRTNSIIHSKIDDSKLILLKNVDEMLNFIKEKYPSLIDCAIRRYVYCNYHILGRAVYNSKYNIVCKNIRKNILKYKHKIFFQFNYSLKEKIATIMLSFGIEQFKFFWNMYSFFKKKNRWLNE